MDAETVITINLPGQKNPAPKSSAYTFSVDDLCTLYSPTDDFICTGRWRIDHINTDNQVLKVEITYNKYEVTTELARVFGIFCINKSRWTKTNQQTEWIHEDEFQINVISEIQECSYKRIK